MKKNPPVCRNLSPETADLPTFSNANMLLWTYPMHLLHPCQKNFSKLRKVFAQIPEKSAKINMKKESTFPLNDPLES